MCHLSVDPKDDHWYVAAQAPNVVRPLRVFVASPGGVEDERQAARDIATELNVPLRRNGWEIVVLGWEDRGPTGGRAQADINKDVRLCDVFVGIVSNRWGTPTGEHTSGFAEEWAIARERHTRSGQPDLWLFFKKVPDDASEDAQLEAVRDLRKEVEDGDFAFYKTFDDVAGFAQILRPRLLDEVLDRSGLTRTDLGAAAIDWAAAYDEEPVALLPDGRNRAALADELEASRPVEAAALLVALAGDAEERGFEPTAEHLRARACRVQIKAGDSAAAVALMRALLIRHVWELRVEEADILLRQMHDDLPPELAMELTGWRACLDAPNEPEATAAALAGAMRAQHAFPLDSETIAHWRAVRWRCLLQAGDPQAVIKDHIENDAKRGGVHLELALLQADALRAADHTGADAAWQELRLLAISEATENPELSAWISTRAALDAFAQEDLTTAEAAYADAATRWTKVVGASENAALAFFSAQAASQLRGDWSFTGWGWRPIAAAQFSKASGPVARAEELERRALNQRLDDRNDDAIAPLRAALWCHLRAGFVHGVMRARALLADAYAAAGDETRAVALNCEVGQRSEAEELAGNATDQPAVAARMAGAWPAWAAESRFAVLAQVGGYARPPVVNQLTAEALAATEANPERQFDNTPVQAAEALAALVVAVEDEGVLRAAVAKLEELAADQHYSLAQAGRLGLRMLDDVGAVDAAETLIQCFLADSRQNEPDPAWIAQKLTDPTRLERVRQAARAGHKYALLALIEAGLPARDADVRAICAGVTRSVLQSDLGMTPDGSGMWGLMALDVQGAIAAASGDDALSRAFAETLLVYAAESRWPMVNRVSAVRGLWPILRVVPDVRWLDALLPLARPDADHDEETAPHLREMWARSGDLESTALAVCGGLAASNPPAWLDDAIREARFDERAPMRETAWRAAGQRAAWFESESARHALRDESAAVRIAALHAWRKQGPALPQAELRRLVNDKSGGVRLALTVLLEEAPDDEAITTLRNDPAAYVRGIARKRLRVEDEP